MSTRSAVPGGGFRVQFWLVPLLLVIALVAIGLMAMACGGSTNVRTASANALSGLQTSANATQLHSALDDKLNGDNLGAVESAVKEAHDTRNATYSQIALALYGSKGSSLSDTLGIIESVNSSAADNPSGSATAPSGTATTPAGQSADDIKQAILSEVDAKIKQAQDNTKASLEYLRQEIEDKTAQTVANERDDLEKLINSLQTASSDGNNGNDNTGKSASGGTPVVPTNPGTVSGSGSGCGFNPNKPVNYWGPAGIAPQCETDAAALLKADVQFLTILNPSAADDTAIGWVLGRPVPNAP